MNNSNYTDSGSFKKKKNKKNLLYFLNKQYLLFHMLLATSSIRNADNLSLLAFQCISNLNFFYLYLTHSSFCTSHNIKKICVLCVGTLCIVSHRNLFVSLYLAKTLLFTWICKTWLPNVLSVVGDYYFLGKLLSGSHHNWKQAPYKQFYFLNSLSIIIWLLKFLLFITLTVITSKWNDWGWFIYLEPCSCYETIAVILYMFFDQSVFMVFISVIIVFKVANESLCNDIIR